jgi:hypothetical protein
VTSHSLNPNKATGWARRRILAGLIACGGLTVPLVAAITYQHLAESERRAVPPPAEVAPADATWGKTKTLAASPVAFRQPEEERRFKKAVEEGKRASIAKLQDALARAVEARSGDPAYLRELERQLSLRRAELEQVSK